MMLAAATPFEKLLDWKFLDAIVSYYADTGMGELGFFLVFLGGTFMGIYQATGSVMLSVVAIILLAPLIAGLLPALGIQFIAIVLLIMMAVGGYMLYQRAGR